MASLPDGFYHLLLAVPANYDTLNEDDDVSILHVCAYEAPPTQTDVDTLYAELASDPTFNLIDVPIKIVGCPQPLAEQLLGKLKESTDWIED
jgi:hypothetical protein